MDNKTELDLSNAERLHNGHADVYRIRDTSAPSQTGSLAGYLAIKVVSAYAVRPPHDVRQEISLLSRLHHANLIPLIQSYLSPASDYHLVMPYYPLPLDFLLKKQFFTPADLSEAAFQQLAKSIIKQSCAGLAHLHDRCIAHRDVKPGNILLGPTGQLVLIDLGTAYNDEGYSSERPGSMIFDVGSGSYKAPEVLFGSRDYDACALDLWALGATLAELFCSIEEKSAADEEEDLHFDEAEEPAAPSISLFGLKPPKKWQRIPLFGSYVGDIALIGRIFKVVGTPTIVTWPEAASLPDFDKVHFKVFPPSSLDEHLPNLPSDSAEKRQLVDLLHRLLDLSAGRRIRADEVLELEWLRNRVDVDCTEMLSGFLPVL